MLTWSAAASTQMLKVLSTSCKTSMKYLLQVNYLCTATLPGDQISENASRYRLWYHIATSLIIQAIDTSSRYSSADFSIGTDRSSIYSMVCTSFFTRSRKRIRWGAHKCFNHSFVIRGSKVNAAILVSWLRSVEASHGFQHVTATIWVLNSLLLIIRVLHLVS